jgi:hypothetical protein
MDHGEKCRYLRRQLIIRLGLVVSAIPNVENAVNTYPAVTGMLEDMDYG